MIFLDELKPLKLYKRTVWLPINLKNKRKGSVIYLLTPNYQSTVNIINSTNFFDTRYYNSYFVEKDITFLINSKKELVRDIEVQEESAIEDYPIYLNPEQDYICDDKYLATREAVIFFNDNDDDNVILSENAANDAIFRRLLFRERIKTIKDLTEIHEKIKKDCPKITRTRLSLDLYKQFNLYYDLSYYNDAFFRNNMYKMKKGTELYLDLMDRLIHDRRLESYGYTNNKLVMIPINDWDVNKSNKNYIYKNDINPVSIIIYLLRTDPDRMRQLFGGMTFLFYTNKGYFKVDIDTFDMTKYPKFLTLLNNITDPKFKIEEDDEEENSPKGITTAIIDKIETSTGINIDDLDTSEDISSAADLNKISGEDLDKIKHGKMDPKEMKKLLVSKIEKAAEENPDEESTMEDIDDDEEIKQLLNDIVMNDEKGVKMTAARAARLTALNSEFEKSRINNKTVSEIINSDASYKPIEKTSLNIDTINEEWNDLTYINFEKSYDLNDDIIKILYFLTSRDYPISIIKVDIEDTSTSEDWIYTYHVNCEDMMGNRFTLVFDIPKFKNKRFMMLRGNEKVMSGQLALIGISKTDSDTVQIVSNYQKIFIKRFGTRLGKSLSLADRIIKVIKKYDGNKIHVKSGYNAKICAKYELPIDYIDLSCAYTRINTSHHIIYFNQDEIREKYKEIIDQNTVKIPYAYNKKDKEIIYFDGSRTFSEELLDLMDKDTNGEFSELCKKTMLSTKYCYSQASILYSDIPLILLMCYSEGLQKTLERCHVKYELREDKVLNKLTQDFIRFKNGYLIYDIDYNSSLLLNGLKECDTASYNLSDIDSKAMYLDFLEDFGGRIQADGIENFYQLMIDPITVETLKFFKLPTEYHDLLAYANELLADNVFVRHADLSTNRYRTNEQIAAYFYKVISREYGIYRINIRRNSDSKMSIKRTAVIDELLKAKEFSDLSIMTPLLEVESANTASFKGVSGMNPERAYKLDKRIYDDTMINVLALSTNFAGNVGVTRPTTIDMNIDSVRGYIKQSSTDDMSVTKSLAMTEALNPFTSIRDDPIRTAMNFIQSSKHTMATDFSDPLLISNGADEAMAYICSDTFAVKAKEDGFIKELTDDYMIVEYPSTGSCEYVNLKKTVRHNSSGGFFVTIKLDAAKGLKVGDKVAKNQIVAYNSKMFSDTVGWNDNISYNVGTLCKIAIPLTDEGYEDSAIISNWLSEALQFTLTVDVEHIIDKDCNIFEMVKKGDKISEGDPLMIYQKAYDEDDINIILKNISDEQIISDFGRTKVKSKITGYVEDIEILRTCEIEDMSESLQKIVTEYEKPITAMKKKLEKYDPEAAKNLPADYKLPPIGRLKNCEDKISIIFYLSYKNKMTVGNKLTFFSALKGVVRGIFKEGDEPTSEYRKDEKIHAFMSAPSATARMTMSPFANGGINKVCIELARHCQEIMGLPILDLDSYLNIDQEE